MKFLILSLIAGAAIPSGRMIVQRTVDNAGTGSYVIEQEVQFPNGTESFALKEVWVVENDRSMRVTVTPLRDPKDSVHIQILYAGGRRWIMKNGKRDDGSIPADFAERPFHFRTPEAMGRWLSQNKIAPANALAKKPLPRRLEDIKHAPEDFLRLARVDGVIAWAFGSPSSPKGDPLPGLWIEQDVFLIRKIRFPSGAEISAEDYSSYARGLHFPRARTIRWGANSVSLRVLSVAGRAPAIPLSSLDTSWKVQGLEGQPAQTLIEEFYTRFR